jgi:hypothetical protein
MAVATKAAMAKHATMILRGAEKVMVERMGITLRTVVRKVVSTPDPI